VDASLGTAYSIDRFPVFESYLHASYEPIAVVDGVILYERRASSG
jgi:hypothetical protein